MNNKIIMEIKHMKKSITWYQLWKRIGKQTIHKTRNTKVQILVDGELIECALVFTNNGSDFHLEPVRNTQRHSHYNLQDVDDFKDVESTDNWEASTTYF